MKGKFWPHVIVLCALLLPGVAGMGVRADPGVIDNPSQSGPKPGDSQGGGFSNLYPAQMDPPSSCGVPLGGPFGKDAEILLNDIQYELEPDWYPQTGIPYASGFFQPSSDIAAAALSTEQIAAVWRDGGVAGHVGELHYSIWDASHDVYAWGPMAGNGPFEDAGGWWYPQHYATIHTGDIDGDGADELLGRAVAGMEAYRFNGIDWEQIVWGGPFSDATGWGDPKHYRTIHSGDIDGDGVDELLGRAVGGMEAYRFNGTGWDLVAQGGPFPDGTGWEYPQYYETIHSGDIDGDGVDELLGRGGGGMEAYRFNGTGWELIGQFGPFPDATGWGDPKHYRTIHSGDIDGDGVDELLGRTVGGMEAYRFNGTGWDLIDSGGPFEDAGGWEYPQYYATIHSADIDGDGADELLGRAEAGMVAYRFNGIDWELIVWGGPFSNATGWNVAKHYETIHSGDIDGDGVDELLGRAAPGMEAHRFSDSPGGWGGEEGWLGPVPAGNPAILATGGHRWEVYARGSAGQIQYRMWVSPTLIINWQTVPGTTDVASDPVVVSRRSGHIALFYQDSGGEVWFTEREGGVVWRESPLRLTRHRVFLPVVSKAGSGAAATPSGWQTPDRIALSPVAFVSELSAISRHENHLAVFAVDELGRLWAKDWTTLNASDWSDTHWVKLMEGVALEKPAVASRHSNHLAVAVRDTSGMAHQIEWTDQTGWGPPVSLGETFAGPLTLAVIETDELFLFGLDAHNLVSSLHWTQDAGWEGPETGPKVGVQDQVISAVVRRPGDLMFFARGGVPVLRHFTSQRRDLTQTDRDLAPPQDEFYRSQLLVRVGSRSYYLAADEGGSGSWKIEGWDLDGDTSQPSLTLVDHPYVAGSPVSVAAGDLDFDGSDEVIVATYAHPTASVSVLDLSVVSPGTTPTLTMVLTATVAETFPITPAMDLSLAIGDLDGDGRRSEVVLAATLDNPALVYEPVHAVAKLYQFVPGQPARLQEKSDGFLVIDNNSPLFTHWELEVAAGRLGWSYPGDQLAVAISGLLPDFFATWGSVNTYGILTSGSHWTFVEVYHHLAAFFGDTFYISSVSPYRSAIATADLDVDGYQEIAAWYLDRIHVLDTNDLDGGGNPTVRWLELEPKNPLDNGRYLESPRSLALDDIDRDGRAEIAAAAWLFEPATGEYGYRLALLELLGDGALTPTGYGQAQPGREAGTVLVGDVDGDGLVSELVGCNAFGEYTVVAVVNGLPRWYEDGVPVFDSTGSYSVEEGGGSSQSSGTTYNLGASLTIGYEQEINVPFVGKVAAFRASVTQDFMSSSGFSQESEEFTAFGSDYSFEEGLGIVVYNVVETACYYYDVFSPDSPEDTVRAMSCRPSGLGYIDTSVMTLDLWHSPDTKDAASWSWVDVGHRTVGGVLTNDLAEPGSYSPVLPVDKFMLLFEFPAQHIEQTGGAQESWYAREEWGRARTEFSEIEENTTLSIGASVYGFSVDASGTYGMGWNNSNTISWSDSIMFAGGYSWAGGAYPSYWVRPYAYQAMAKTLAGTTYPYWVMDYYVPGLGQ